MAEGVVNNLCHTNLKNVKNVVKEFVPNSGKQNYCKDIHYRPCPICSKPVKVKHF